MKTKFFKKLQLVSLVILFFSITVSAQTYTTWTQSSILKFPLNGVGQPTGIGRVTHFAFHPTDSKTIFATSASGGLWKTTTEGEYWYNLNTDFFPWTTKMSCVVVDYTNPDIIYVGTGDTDYQSWWSGRGVWKSTNGGSTWSQLINTLSSGNKLVNRMIMSPFDHTVLLAAVYDGVYKSTDAGATWTRTLASNNMRDVVMKPSAGGSNTVYACSDSKFWISTDYGNTWTDKTTSLSNLDSPTAFGSLRIGVSAANANIVYVLAQIDNTRTFAGLFRSTDSGVNFSRMSAASNPPTLANPNILCYNPDGSESGGQGGYNLCITVHPDNADIVYIGSHNIWKSTDGGSSWQNRSCWYCGGTTGLHTDIHYLMFSPHYASPRKLYVAMDGGMARTLDNNDNYWEACSDGIAATEYGSYGNSHLYKELYLGGTQDNGLQFYWNGDITTIGGGDYYEDFEFDEFDSQYTYADQHYEKRTFDMSGGQSSQGSWATKDNLGNDLTSPLDNTGNSPKYFTSGASTNVLYAYKTKIWIMQNLKAASPVWKEMPLSNPSTNTYAHGAASSLNNNLIYLVRKDNTVYRSDNAQAATPAFVTLTIPSGASSSSNAYIAPHGTNENVVWIAFNNRVYRSNDKGANFTNITGTLPNLTIQKVIHDRFNANEGVYISNSSGVYYRDNTMSDWVLFSRGMPTIADITDMDMYSDGTSKSVLRVATYGRGIWQAELYNAAATSPKADYLIYTTQKTIGGNGNPSDPCNNYYMLKDKSTGQPTSWSWSFSPSAGVTFVNETSSASRNPIVQLSTSGLYTVTLTVTNAQGSNSFTDSIRYFKLSVPAVCTPVVTDQYGAPYGIGITRVQFSDINNGTSMISSYNDYTCTQTAIVTEGQTYPLTVTTGTFNGGDNVVVWIDYNNNGSFADAGEQIYNGPNGALTHSANITIPSSVSVVTNIPLRMRVVGYDNWKTKTTNTCINNVYNEIEDYAVMIVVTSPLPVEMISFYASIESPAVRLNWITAKEKNVSYFLIEKTNEENSVWEQVDIVGSKGISEDLTSYYTYDNKPGTGIVFYRIKTFDKDGSVSSTKIVSVNLEGKFNYSIYPNPSSDVVNVFSNTNVAVNDYASIVIRNIEGKEVKRTEMLNQSTSFSIKELPSGIYMLEIYNDDRVFYKKMVKQ